MVSLMISNHYWFSWLPLLLKFPHGYQSYTVIIQLGLHQYCPKYECKVPCFNLCKIFTLPLNQNQSKISQIKGKESENSYQELKRSPKDRHTQTVSRYFDRHGRIFQSEESKCLWTHDEEGITREFTKGATWGLREGWMEGNNLR